MFGFLNLFREQMVQSLLNLYSLVEKYKVFLVSFVIAVIFFYPSLVNGAANAGFIYVGDMLGWYLPALVKTHYLFHDWNFTALDYSAFNGSSDFFTTAVFFYYHPLVIFFSVIVPPESLSIHYHVAFLVALIVFHCFLGCYFAIKLAQRFFDFDFYLASFIGILFIFNTYTISGIGQPPFVFAATMMPWITYSALLFADKPTLRKFLLAMFPVVVMLLTGYMPLGVASLILSAVLISVKYLYIDADTETFRERLTKLVTASTPFFAGCLLVLPYLITVFLFHHESPAAGIKGIAYAAHDLGQLPQIMLKALSPHIGGSTPFHEYKIFWGFICISIGIIFLFSSKATRSVTTKEWKIFQSAGVIYFATVIATFGAHSALSDLVYYLVPQVGSMHIYQRFLQPAQLLFAILMAIMLKHIIREVPLIATKVCLGGGLLLTFLVTVSVIHFPSEAAAFGLHNYLIFELFLGLIFLSVLVLPNKKFIIISATGLILLPTLNQIYDYSLGNNSLAYQKTQDVYMLDEDKKNELVTYMKKYNDKEVLKYVDTTPLWGGDGAEWFPKFLPYYLKGKINVNSFSGFTSYLSTRKEYISRMPTEVIDGEIIVRNDWELVKETGADFVIARASDVAAGKLDHIISAQNKANKLDLAKGVVVIPLRNLPVSEENPSKTFFDNGMFRLTEPRKFSRNDEDNIAIGKPVTASAEQYIHDFSVIVDGNKVGVFADKSVSHSGDDINAWYQIDLGKVSPIDLIRIFNRSECCGERLKDYWVFVSKYPFSQDSTAKEIQVDPNVWKYKIGNTGISTSVYVQGFEGRYVRVQFSGEQYPIGRHLSLSEVQVFPAESVGSGVAANISVSKFSSDWAKYSVIEFETDSPAMLQYLFFDNPRLKYYLNSEPVELMKSDNAFYIEVPKGKHVFEIQYRHWPLSIFVGLYFLFTLILLTVLMFPNLSRLMRAKLS